MNPDQLFRRRAWFSIILLGGGSLLFVVSLGLPSNIQPYVLSGGVIALIVGLAMRAMLLIDRIGRFLRGQPLQPRSILPPPQYICPKCGYQLRGVEGVFCPECGIVRPARVGGEEDD